MMQSWGETFWALCQSWQSDQEFLFGSDTNIYNLECIWTALYRTGKRTSLPRAPGTGSIFKKFDKFFNSVSSSISGVWRLNWVHWSFVRRSVGFASRWSRMHCYQPVCSESTRRNLWIQLYVMLCLSFRLPILRSSSNRMIKWYVRISRYPL